MMNRYIGSDDVIRFSKGTKTKIFWPPKKKAKPSLAILPFCPFCPPGLLHLFQFSKGLLRTGAQLLQLLEGNWSKPPETHHQECQNTMVCFKYHLEFAQKLEVLETHHQERLFNEESLVFAHSMACPTRACFSRRTPWSPKYRARTKNGYVSAMSHCNTLSP